MIISDWLLHWGKDLWDDRPENTTIDTIVIHAINARSVSKRYPLSVKNCIKTLLYNSVSAHYIIGRIGDTFRLVPEDKRAWHAGVSKMPAPDNRQKVNDFSVGIEVVGNEEEPFTDQQYEVLNDLIADIKRRNNITAVVGHSQIATQELVDLGLREEAKWDPGKMFDWKRLK